MERHCGVCADFPIHKFEEVHQDSAAISLCLKVRQDGNVREMRIVCAGSCGSAHACKIVPVPSRHDMASIDDQGAGLLCGPLFPTDASGNQLIAFWRKPTSLDPQAGLFLN
eukprot:s1_g315.t1